MEVHLRSQIKYFKDAPKNGDTRVNNKIRAKEVRLIDAEGTNHGVVSVKDALDLARTAGLDLVEVADKVQPPVCKIMDYGKYLYEQKKKQKDIAKSSKHEDKEIRLTANIGDHDLTIKANKVKEFLAEGRKVNISVRLKGREKSRPELAKLVVDRLFEMIKEEARLEQRGNTYILIPT